MNWLCSYILFKMSTTVVNVKVEFIRPKYKTLKDWCDDPQNVYIGRAGIVFVNGKRYPDVSSPWANPFKDGSREENIENYKSYIQKRFNLRFEEELEKLRGKTLGCWCKPTP